MEGNYTNGMSIIVNHTVYIFSTCICIISCTYQQKRFRPVNCIRVLLAISECLCAIRLDKNYNGFIVLPTELEMRSDAQVYNKLYFGLKFRSPEIHRN